MDAFDKKWVYIVDDDVLVRQSIHAWLSIRDYAPRSFATPLDFLDDIDNLKPGCALLDVRMPIIDGIQMLDQHRLRLQQMEVIMMTGHADVGMAVNAMKLGAFDFIEKPFKQDELLKAIERAHERLSVRVADNKQVHLARSLINSLTPRECEVFNALSSGFSNKLMAHELNLSIRTVEMHRANVMKKLGIRSQAQLAKLALESESRD